MSPIRARFGRDKVLLVVVHLPLGEAGAFDAVSVARDAGADGVFLIDQGMTAREVLALAPRIRARHPDLWMGVNLLGHAPEAVVALDGFDGVWADDAGVDARDPRAAAAAAERLAEARRASSGSGLYFGGTAFKTQAPIPRDALPEVARAAASFVDVVTTSGAGTGIAVDVDKVRILREALGAHPLAVASGVTPENVGGILPYVDAVLVATGIERAFGVLDPARTRALAERVHGG